MEQFDDVKLVSIARTLYSLDSSEDKANTGLELIFKKKELKNEDRNRLLNFIDQQKYSKPMTIFRMKQEILDLCKYEGRRTSYGVVSREELEAIYSFVKEQTK